MRAILPALLSILLGGAALALELDDGVPLGTGYLRDRGPVGALQFSPDGARLFTGDDNGTVVIRNGATRRVIATFTPVTSRAVSLPGFAFAPVTSSFFIATGREILVQDTGTGELKARIRKLPFETRQVVVSPDGARLGVRYPWSSKRVDLLDATDGSLIRTHELENPLEIAFTPDGSSLVASGDDAVFFFDTATGEEKKKIVWRKRKDVDAKDEPKAGAHMPGKLALTAELLATAGGSSIRLFSLESGKIQTEHKLEKHVTSVAFSPNGKRLIAGCEDGTVHIFSVASERELGVIEAHQGTVSALAYSPDGTTIATCGKDGLVRGWEAKTGDELEPLVGHTQPIASIAFFGSQVVTAGKDGRVLFWDAATGNRVREREGRSVVASVDGTGLAIATEETVEIWKKGKVRATIEEKLVLVGFTSDSKHLVALEGSNALHVYNTADGDRSVAVDLDGPVEHVTLDPLARAAWFTDASGEIKRADLDRGKVESMSGRAPWGLAVSPDGKELAVIDKSSNLRVIDPSTGERKRKLGKADGPLVWKGDVLVAGARVLVGDAETALPFEPGLVAISPDGKLVAATDRSGFAYVFKLK